MTTRGIDNDDFKALRLEALHTLLGNCHGITLRVAVTVGAI
jgi:hypothetical protein